MIGLGAMGSRIATRLRNAGHEMAVWNRTPEKAAPLAELGATVASSPAEAAASSEFVLTMVADPAALAAVTEGPSGVAAGARAGTVVVEMSTVGPAAVERLSRVLPERVELVDAPVLGSLAEAEAGTLTVFAGGAAEAVERCRPLFEILGSLLHVGGTGAGAAAKLVANSTLFGSLAVLGEAVALADALGVPRQAAFDVLSATPIAAQAGRRKESLENGDYPLRFALSLAAKDARLVAEAARAAGIDVRAAEAALSWLDDAVEAGWGDRDYSEVLEIVTRRGLQPR